MELLVHNLNICVLQCKAHRQEGNQKLCIHNNRPIQENASKNDCPFPHGSRFIQTSIRPVATDWWSIAGPLLWKELHIWTLTAHLINDRDWLKNFLKKIMCGECKDHAIRWIAQHPPDFSSHEKLFAWGVDFHNAVNERLEKPTMPYADAFRRWSAETRPSPKIGGCSGC